MGGENQRREIETLDSLGRSSKRKRKTNGCQERTEVFEMHYGGLKLCVCELVHPGWISTGAAAGGSNQKSPRESCNKLTRDLPVGNRIGEKTCPPGGGKPTSIQRGGKNTSARIQPCFLSPAVTTKASAIERNTPIPVAKCQRRKNYERGGKRRRRKLRTQDVMQYSRKDALSGTRRSRLWSHRPKSKQREEASGSQEEKVLIRMPIITHREFWYEGSDNTGNAT